MKEFFYEFFIQPFKDNDIFLGIISWCIALFSLSFVSFFVLWGIDELYLPIKQDKGIIHNHYISESDEYISYTQVGDVAVPITYDSSTTYNLEIKVNHSIGSMSVKESDYYEVNDGDSLICNYKVGRIFGILYFKDITVINQ